MAKPCWLALGLVLVGCGGNARSSTKDQPGTGGSGAPGTIDPDPDPEPEAPMQIAGRWAQFGFEDPVGVKLIQTKGSLVGEGCAAGTPPLQMAQQYCGAIEGKITGHLASFGFHFDRNDYRAETVVSGDGRRMTGRFHGASAWLEHPTAWLRVADDAAFLESMGAPNEPEGLAGWYELEITEADGDEYQWKVPYRVYYSRRAIQGALGSFWGTETTDPALGSPIRVGPVPATSPELPVDLSIDFAASGLTSVRAKTASGNSYTFRATREP
jgi:hypothetical protein